MQIIHNDENITIVNDFLDQETLSKVRDQSECLKMKKLELGDDKVYKMNVGDIYKSENKYWTNKLPWNNNLEPFIHKLIDFIKNNKTCLPADEFEKISCMLHVYLSGSELSWHRDGALGGGATDALPLGSNDLSPTTPTGPSIPDGTPTQAAL